MKQPEWKQPTPFDQLTALLGSFEGDFSNFEDGVISREKLIDRAKSIFGQLHELTYFIKNPGEWDA